MGKGLSDMLSCTRTGLVNGGVNSEMKEVASLNYFHEDQTPFWWVYCLGKQKKVKKVPLGKIANIQEDKPIHLNNISSPNKKG